MEQSNPQPAFPVQTTRPRRRPGQHRSIHRQPFPAKTRTASGRRVFLDGKPGAFLRDEILDDADWAEVVDQLNVLLRKGREG
jgi:hypothetical protein